MASYSLTRARKELGRLLELACSGEEVTITRRGRSIARIVRHPALGTHIDVEWLDRVRVKGRLSTSSR